MRLHMTGMIQGPTVFRFPAGLPDQHFLLHAQVAVTHVGLYGR